MKHPSGQPRRLRGLLKGLDIDVAECEAILSEAKRSLAESTAVLSEARRTLEGELEKDFRSRCVRNLISVIIIASLKEAPKSGYEVITYIYDRFKVFVSPGTIYPSLALLEEEGLIVKERVNGKWVYKPTLKGDKIATMLLETYSSINTQL